MKGVTDGPAERRVSVAQESALRLSRRITLLSAVLTGGSVLCAVTGAGAADAHAYVRVWDSDYGRASVSYWDSETARRAGAEASIEVLTVAADGPATDLDRRVNGTIEHLTVDCDWGVTRSLDERAWSGDPANVGQARSAPDRPRLAADVALLASVCDTAPPPRGSVFATPAEVVADATTLLRRPRKSPPTYPSLARLPTPDGGFGFSMVQSDTRGRAVFLSWRGMQRWGTRVDAATLWLMGPEAADADPAIAYRTMTFDCQAGTVLITAQRMWSRQDREERGPPPRQPAHPVAGLPATQALLQAACTQAQPVETVADVPAALAQAMSVWPGARTSVAAARSAPAPTRTAAVSAPPQPRGGSAAAPPTRVAALPRLPAGALIQRPEWLKRPSGDELINRYPARASAKGIEGAATIECSATANGSLTDCSVISETPAEYGFGSAALGVASKFKLKPTTAEGASVEGGKVRIPLRWKVE